MQDVPELQRRVAALVAGTYAGTSCSPIPDLDGSGSRPGQLRIGRDGSVSLGPERMPMFGPAMSIVIGWRNEQGVAFNFEIVEGQQRHLMLSSTNDGPTVGFIEMGQAPGGQSNVTDGQMCADLDMRDLPLLAPPNPLGQLMTELYDTGGQVIQGDCRNLGAKVNGHRVGGETRRASYSVRRDAVVLNGKPLPLRDSARPLTAVDLGSQQADGSVNGSFHWADGSNFHVEQFVGAPLAVSMFSFSEGEARWHCRPAR